MALLHPLEPPSSSDRSFLNQRTDSHQRLRRDVFMIRCRGMLLQERRTAGRILLMFISWFPFLAAMILLVLQCYESNSY